MSESNGPVVDLDTYQSIKKVRAGEITEVVEAGCYVKMRDGGSVLLMYQEGMTARYTPVVGDFWVVYEPDNYSSISPRQQFIDGYRLPFAGGDDLGDSKLT